MKFVLPLPPGINKTYGVNRRSTGPALYKRGEVRDWEHEAGWIVRRQVTRAKFAGFSGSVTMGIDWYVKINRDIDAGLKVLLDLFTKQRVYADDRQVRYIDHIGIYQDKNNPRVEVTINEMTEGGE